MPSGPRTGILPDPPALDTFKEVFAIARRRPIDSAEPSTPGGNLRLCYRREMRSPLNAFRFLGRSTKAAKTAASIGTQDARTAPKIIFALREISMAYPIADGLLPPRSHIAVKRCPRLHQADKGIRTIVYT